MKILAFTDVHCSKAAMQRVSAAVRKHKPDIIVCCGDLTIFGNGLKQMLKWLDSLGTSALVHGNHETEQEMRAACKKFPRINFIHKRVTMIKGIKFAGHGGGGFSYRDTSFEHWTAKNSKELRDDFILVTHAPPFGTPLDDIYGSQVGSKSYREFILKTGCKLALSGHIHEAFGRVGKLGKALVLNPGPFGKVIEL